MTMEEALLVAVLQNQRAMMSALSVVLHLNGERNLAIELHDLSKNVRELLERHKLQSEVTQ